MYRICQVCSEENAKNFTAKVAGKVTGKVTQLVLVHQDLILQLDTLKSVIAISGDLTQTPSRDQRHLVDLLRVGKLTSDSEVNQSQQQLLRHLARVLDDYGGTMDSLDEMLSTLRTFTLQAVTVTRKTYPEILEEPGKYRKVVNETFQMMHEGLFADALGFPGAGAIAALHLQPTLNIHAVLWGPPLKDIQGAWLAVTGDSKEALVEPIYKLEGWCRYMQRLAEELDPVDLVRRWKAAPRALVRYWGALSSNRRKTPS